MGIKEAAKKWTRNASRRQEEQTSGKERNTHQNIRVRRVAVAATGEVNTRNHLSRIDRDGSAISRSGSRSPISPTTSLLSEVTSYGSNLSSPASTIFSETPSRISSGDIASSPLTTTVKGLAAFRLRIFRQLHFVHDPGAQNRRKAVAKSGPERWQFVGFVCGLRSAVQSKKMKRISSRSTSGWRILVQSKSLTLSKSWADEHSPTTLSAFRSQPETVLRLQQLVCDGNIPHLVLQGPHAAGKRSLIKATLLDVYGNTILKEEREDRRFAVPRGRMASILVPILSSACHMEVDVKELGENDEDVLPSLMKEMAMSCNASPVSVGKLSTVEVPFKVLVLKNAESLSVDGQVVLRRLMDRYGDTCRVILCCNTYPSSPPYSALRGFDNLCQTIYVPHPPIAQIVEVLQEIATKECFELLDGYARRIATESCQNLHQAIVSLEACKNHRYPFTEDQPVELGYWEQDVVQTAADLMTNPTLRQLFNVRPKLQRLIQSNIPAELILKKLEAELVRRLFGPSQLEQVRNEIHYWAAYFVEADGSGSIILEWPLYDPLFRLEAFIAKFISIVTASSVTTQDLQMMPEAHIELACKTAS